MPVSFLDPILFLVLFTLLLALLVGVVVTWLWALRRLWLQIPLLSDLTVLPAREAPWELSSILLAVFLYLSVNFVVFNGYGWITGRRLPAREPAGHKVMSRETPMPGGSERTAPGTDLERQDAEEANPERPKLAQPERDAGVGAVQSEGELLLQSAIINALLILLVPPVILRRSGAQLSDLGWDTRDWQRQVFQGVRAALLVTPIVFTVQALAVRIWQHQKHLLDEMVTKQFSPGTAVLAIVSAIVLAPFVEEMLFRGLLQRWLGKNPRRALKPDPLEPDDVSPVREEAAGSRPEEEEADAPDKPLAETASVWEDRLASPSEPPLSGEERSERPTPAELANLNAIFVSSALFAGMHYLQWPAPIAIFVLSVWLGTVYARSRSLITAVALHATFNSFSTTMLLLDAVGRRIGASGPHAMFDFLSRCLP